MVYRRVILACVVGALLSPAALLAQGGYFGRNKVQYQTFDFQVLHTDHFDIHYYPEMEDGARMAARMAERWYARLSALLNHDLRGRQPLILYASNPHFWQTNAVPGSVGEGTGGVTEAYKRRIVLPLAGPIEATDHVLGHELVHAFQYDITGTNVNTGEAGALALPLWFIEGMAEYLSIGPVDPHTAMWMREAATREALPAIRDLANPRYFPYRYGHAVWAFIGARHGDQVIGDVLRAASGRGGWAQAFQQVLGVDSGTLTEQWHEALLADHQVIAEATTAPGDQSRLLIRSDPRHQLNVSPEVSPDGTRFMFFSERGLFSIDLFMADAHTGRVIRKVTDTATDPHFESLLFLTSAGAWSTDGTRFVFPGISRGAPVLRIIDVESGQTRREIRFTETVDEVLNPTWSPDGRLIAFSGISGGFTDLFVYDLDADELQRLTSDAFAEVQPRFSPDGRQIAFSTDRFTTDLPTLASGHLRLAILDLDSGAIHDVGGFAGAKNIGPQWTDDGAGLYFLSDRGGITNIYRMRLDGAEVVQLTNLVTGVSGITALSPAMSSAGDRILFSTMEDRGYSVYALEGPERLAGLPIVELPRHAAVLSPRDRGDGPVRTTLADATLGLIPAATDLPTESYRPRLSLDYAGQPAIGVGRDAFGTYAAGGVSFLFSDMLGHHTVGTSAQVTNRFDEFGGSAAYINRTRRWNWGAVIEQTPYVARGFATGLARTPAGQLLYVEEEYRILQVDRALQGIVSYPFSRAQRVDVAGGLRQIGFTQDVTTRVFSRTTGQLLSEDRRDLVDLPNVNLAQGSAALVWDTSIFGATSPIRGSRSRLELSQVAGSLQYTGTLADVRVYVMPFRPYTIALRGLYFGRHGGGADDQRLPTLYLGYPGLVRGYDAGTFRSTECGQAADILTCPAFDRLVGTQIAVANAEIRFPLWGAFGGQQFYGPLPVELAVFADGGVAWGGSRFTDTARDPVASIGAAARVNLLGFAIAEINYVRPLQRPERGWLWQFNLMPGF
ncbi:MAG: BamA/TamA family outer membrane protein [Vicinamibacterales bacterium]|nr:BamA/TamA family outer membrane protein [Vicinamibacterales bacterium]